MNKRTIITPYIIPLTASILFARINSMRYSRKDFEAEYPDDQACLVAVLENRYGSTCPRCCVIGVKFHPITGRKGFVCSECDRHIYPLANTIFRKSETSMKNWFIAIFMFSTHKNGVAAKTIERELGVTYKTAWRMCKQIRLLM
jgi:transposase-like protein